MKSQHDAYVKAVAELDQKWAELIEIAGNTPAENLKNLLALLKHPCESPMMAHMLHDRNLVISIKSLAAVALQESLVRMYELVEQKKSEGEGNSDVN